MKKNKTKSQHLGQVTLWKRVAAKSGQQTERTETSARKKKKKNSTPERKHNTPVHEWGSLSGSSAGNERSNDAGEDN